MLQTAECGATAVPLMVGKSTELGATVVTSFVGVTTRAR